MRTGTFTIGQGLLVEQEAQRWPHHERRADARVRHHLEARPPARRRGGIEDRDHRIVRLHLGVFRGQGQIRLAADAGQRRIGAGREPDDADARLVDGGPECRIGEKPVDEGLDVMRAADELPVRTGAGLVAVIVARMLDGRGNEARLGQRLEAVVMVETRAAGIVREDDERKTARRDGRAPPGIDCGTTRSASARPDRWSDR